MMRCSGRIEPGSGGGPGTGHFAESAGLSTNGRGPRARVRAGTVSRRGRAESAAVVSVAALSGLRLSDLALSGSGGATTGRGSHTLGLGGVGAAATAESRGVSRGGDESPHPMTAAKMTRRRPRNGDKRMRPAW